MGDLGFSEGFVVWLLVLGAVVVAVAVVAPFLPKPAERQMRRLVRDHTARWPAPPDLVESSYGWFFAGAAALTRDDMSAARLAFRSAWALGLPAGYTGLGICAWDLRDEAAAGRLWAVAGDAGDVPARVLAHTLREEPQIVGSLINAYLAHADPVRTPSPADKALLDDCARSAGYRWFAEPVARGRLVLSASLRATPQE